MSVALPARLCVCVCVRVRAHALICVHLWQGANTQIDILLVILDRSTLCLSDNISFYSINAGCTALPALLNIKQVMQQRQVTGIWNGKDELPVRNLSVLFTTENRNRNLEREG